MSKGAGQRPIVFINQHYYPDVAPTGQVLTDLAEHMAAARNAVQVLCARGSYRSGHLDFQPWEIRAGVEIRRYWTPGRGRADYLDRLLEYLFFVVQAAWRLLFGPRPAAIVVLTTPPLLPVLAALTSRFRGVPFAVWSMDLHPEAEVAAGMLRPDRGPARLLFSLTREAYRRADLVIVLGRCMRRLVLAMGVPPARIETVNIGAPASITAVDRHENPLLREAGVRPNDFVLMYSGNAGLAHDFQPFLEASRRLTQQAGTRFLFVGDGPRRPEIEAYAEFHGTKNMRLLDYYPRDRLSESLSMADVHFVSLRPEFEGIAVPAKLYGIMASGRPALFLGPASCETARTILEHDCGAVVDPRSERDPASRIVEILRLWRAQPAERERLGGNGRAALLKHFERDRCCVELTRVLEEHLQLGE